MKLLLVFFSAVLLLIAVQLTNAQQFGVNSGAAAAPSAAGFGSNGGSFNSFINSGVDGLGNGKNGIDESIFFHDRQDLQGVWSFGVDGFFIPPMDFAGVIGLANGTIIPTAAVGVFCFDGFGMCAADLTAVIGGNLGSQVFNVSFNKIRLSTSHCRYRVSRLGRVSVQASFSEVSSRFMSRHSLSPPVAIFIQLSSNSFAFIEIDQLFVLEGELVRIQRFNALFDSSQHDLNGPGIGAAPGSDWSNGGLGGSNNGGWNGNNNGVGWNGNGGSGVGNPGDWKGRGGGKTLNQCAAILRLDSGSDNHSKDPYGGGRPVDGAWGSGWDN